MKLIDKFILPASIFIFGVGMTLLVITIGWAIFKYFL